jgi:hypothetical protein
LLTILDRIIYTYMPAHMGICVHASVTDIYVEWKVLGVECLLGHQKKSFDFCVLIYFFCTDKFIGKTQLSLLIK